MQHGGATFEIFSRPNAVQDEFSIDAGAGCVATLKPSGVRFGGKETQRE
jgi:hypothetical protein